MYRHYCRCAGYIGALYGLLACFSVLAEPYTDRSGLTSIGSEESSYLVRSDGEQFVPISEEQLIKRLDPRDLRDFIHDRYSRSGSSRSKQFASIDKVREEATELSYAIAAAQKYKNPEQHRNEVQDVLIVASEIACSGYKSELMQLASEGGATSANLKAILSGEQAREEFRTLSVDLGEDYESFFRDLSPANISSTIFPAIRIERARILDQMLARQRMSYSHYTLYDVFDDITYFHRSCMLSAEMAVTGLGPDVPVDEAQGRDGMPSDAEESIIASFMARLRISLYDRVRTLGEEQVKVLADRIGPRLGAGGKIDIKVYVYDEKTRLSDLTAMQYAFDTMTSVTN